eukprot:CAMPEP_0170192400 /NCGR_PEP_ID=MMETSP0040_2-20121228/54060_1 /TAXON_ID=641309 /ORGANISM="Lotharella oceanica, Strain CCMP622" /LENGTH=99 /DNA_ID=CAMNT_0010440747 /DNA_START=219 /DNA_END=515 /DNA_ORIENTATION=+
MVKGFFESRFTPPAISELVTRSSRALSILWFLRMWSSALRPLAHVGSQGRTAGRLPNATAPVISTTPIPRVTFRTSRLTFDDSRPHPTALEATRDTAPP